MEIEFWLGYDFKDRGNIKLIRSIGTSEYSFGVDFINYNAVQMSYLKCKKLKVKKV